MNLCSGSSLYPLAVFILLGSILVLSYLAIG